MRTLILTPTLAVLLGAAAQAEGPTSAKDAPVNPEYLRQHAATRGVREGPAGRAPLLAPKSAPAGSKAAYALDHDVLVDDRAADRGPQVTKAGTEKKPHGLAEFGAQEEMHRHSGYWWSPDGKS